MSEPQWLNQAINLYTKEHYTYKQIGEIFNISRKTVSYYLRQNGVISNPKYVRHIDPKKLRKYDYSYCENLFETIDTEEKAYWLGFLYADGYIGKDKNTIELALQENDKEHLEKYRQFLHLNNKPFDYKVKHFNNATDKYSYRFSICSAKIKHDLIVLGCCPNKTYILKFPTTEQVPKNLIHHFIRGYIDGDGCIYTSLHKISLEILGTVNFLQGYQEWVNLGNSRIYKFNNANVYRVINSGAYALNILKRIYDKATIFLERKRQKYLDYIAV